MISLGLLIAGLLTYSPASIVLAAAALLLLYPERARASPRPLRTLGLRQQEDTMTWSTLDLVDDEHRAALTQHLADLRAVTRRLRGRLRIATILRLRVLHTGDVYSIYLERDGDDATYRCYGGPLELAADDCPTLLHRLWERVGEPEAEEWYEPIEASSKAWVGKEGGDDE
jgi:hypothetical protein